MSVNDTAERSFGEITFQLQYYGKIVPTNAEGVSQVRVNGYLSSVLDTICPPKKRAEGTLHEISEDMRVSLAKICIEDALAACAADQYALYKQQNAKRCKEELFCDKTDLYVSEKYIDALYYNDMFYSVACWNNAAEIDRDLKNLNSKSSKILVLKENIRMRGIGLSWEELRKYRSKSSKALTPEEITLNLKMIVSKQWSCSIPTKPSGLLPV